MSVFAFLQQFKSACDTWWIHESAKMWLFEQYLTNLTMAVVKARVTLMNSANCPSVSAVKSYFVIVQLLLKRYVRDDNTARLKTKVCNPRQLSKNAEEYAQKLWKPTLTFEYVHKRYVKDLFVEGATYRICKTLRPRWGWHQQASLSDLTQRAESLLDVQGRAKQKETINDEQPRNQGACQNINIIKRQVMNIERSSPHRRS